MGYFLPLSGGSPGIGLVRFQYLGAKIQNRALSRVVNRSLMGKSVHRDEVEDYGLGKSGLS
ncbi:hypothetical protein ES703_10851 [subsurface metagenome]